MSKPWAPSKAVATPIMESENTGSNTLQLLADRYAKKLECIFLKAAKKNFQVPLSVVLYYNNAEANVRTTNGAQ